jgi:hypothetical protein
MVWLVETLGTSPRSNLRPWDVISAIHTMYIPVLLRLWSLNYVSLTGESREWAETVW